MLNITYIYRFIIRFSLCSHPAAINRKESFAKDTIPLDLV